MDDLEKLAKLKKQVASMQREADKAQGALEQVLATLKEEFGCSSLEKAEKLLHKLNVSSEKAEKTFKKAMLEFEQQWGETLHEEEDES